MLADLVSVVIPAQNGGSLLRRVVDVLLRQRAPFPIEILVVDSGSEDGTLAMLRERELRVVEIPAVAFNHGETRNLGIRLSRGERVVLLTQDAVPADLDFVSSLVRRLDEPGVAGVYGRQIARSDCDVVTRRELDAGLTGRGWPDRAQLGERALESLAPSDQQRLCTFDNVCSALKRRVWQEIPFPRVEFGEDVAWGRKVVRAGYGLAYEPTAAVIHSHRRSVRYEYERTRVCHRTLHELFGLAAVPRRRDVMRALLSNLLIDLPFVSLNAPGGSEWIRQMLRAGALAGISPLAQYHGLRDAHRRRERLA